MANQKKNITVSIDRETKDTLEILRGVFGGISLSETIDALINRDVEVKEILIKLNSLKVD